MFISSEVTLWLGSANHLQISYTNHRLVTCIQLIGMIKYNRYVLRTHYVYGNNELPRTQSWSCRIRATVPSPRPRAGLQTGSPFIQIVWWWVRFQGRLFAVRFPPRILFQGASALPSPAPHSPQTLLQKHQNCIRLPRWFSGKESTFQCRRHRRHIWPLGAEDPLEKEMASHSSTLAWKIPWTEEPGGLQYVGSQRVGHDWVYTHTLGSRTFYFSMYSHTISGHILFTQMNDWQMTRLGNSCYRRNFPFKKIQHAHPHRAAVCQLRQGKWLIWYHKGGLSNTPHEVSTFKSSVWLCDPTNCRMPGSSVLHSLPECAQIHIHGVGDAI